MWAATSNGRVFVSKNATTPIRRASRSRGSTRRAQPSRVPVVDLRRPDEPEPRDRHVLGLRLEHADDPGSRLRRGLRPGAGTATWTDISYDLGDQPVRTTSCSTPTTGDVYVSTDFGVNRLASGTTTWVPAADGLPTVTVSGLPGPVRKRARACSTRPRTAGAPTGSSSGRSKQCCRRRASCAAAAAA